MIIRSKAPLRLGLAGGGSDVSPYSDLYGGLILNATINLYAYCTIEETQDGMITIDSFDTHCRKSYTAAETLEIDGDANLIKGVYNHVIKTFGCNGQGRRYDGHFGYNPKVSGFRISTYNDAPAGSGLGTSSTMVVCILKCFAEWMNLALGDYEIARVAYIIERKDLKLTGGKQDQYAASFGGFNYMEFLKNDIVIVNPLKIKRWIIDELESSMVLYYTGKSRSSAAIIEEQQKNTSSGNKTAIDAMHRIKQSSIDMKLALLKGDIREFARIIGSAWEDKKKMAGEITNPTIQEAMDVALESGAMAGKVSGAGGGGFIMLVVEPTRKMEVVDALQKLSGSIVPFQFSDSGAHGWKIYPSDNVNNY
jgi:D-glycero-alpha-D-manno-heptose-7-phosphate kinase